MRKRIIALSIATVLFAPAAFASTGTLAADQAALQSVNTALQDASTAWPQVQQASANYASLANYATEAGLGPQVTVEPYGIEQCHNAQWDNMIDSLVTGGLNLAGDGEAEAYAEQTLAVQWVTDALQVEEDQTQAEAQAGDSAQLSEQLQQMESLSTTLDNLLNEVGNQVAAALGPSSTLQQLPLQQTWQAGIGNYPNLSAVQWTWGPSDGAPIDWFELFPQIGYQEINPQLQDLCPTGSASIPTVSDAQIMAAAQEAVAVQPDLAPQLQSLEGGSTWSLAGGDPYTVRVQLVSDLGYDMGQVSNYLIPLNSDVSIFAKDANTLTAEILQNN